MGAYLVTGITTGIGEGISGVMDGIELTCLDVEAVSLLAAHLGHPNPPRRFRLFLVPQGVGMTTASFESVRANLEGREAYLYDRGYADSNTLATRGPRPRCDEGFAHLIDGNPHVSNCDRHTGHLGPHMTTLRDGVYGLEGREPIIHTERLITRGPVR